MNTSTRQSEPNSGRYTTSLSMRRTTMAADRTLMAWIRTSLSLFSFGFTIYKILEGLQEVGDLPGAVNMPRNVGLFLVGMGTFAIVIGTLEYVTTIRALRPDRRPLLRSIVRSPFIMALIMSITGVALFISIVTKIF